MKKYAVCAVWVLSIFCEEKINLTINNYSTGSSCAASATSQVHTEQMSQLSQVSHNLLQSMTSGWNDFKKSVPSYVDSVWQNKYKIGLTTVGVAYAYLCYDLYAAREILQSHSSWCNWKEVVSTQQLVCASHQELITQLLADIHKKYLLAAKTVSSSMKASPFDQFINDIVKELCALERYITIKKLTKSLYLEKLFYFSYKKSVVQEKIDRLYFMLDVFVAWQTKDLLK